MRQAFILLFAGLLLSTPAWAQSTVPTDPDAMRRCQSFADCTLVWDGCADAAINKLYAAQFKPAAVCAVSKAHDPKAVPTCTDGLCVAVAPEEKK